MSLTPSERLPYSAMADRPRLPLPEGARVVVWPVINVEHWGIERPMARQAIPAPAGVTLLPDIANWAWHEYGMRVGFWRLLAAFQRRDIRGTLSLNGHVCESYPRVAQAALDGGWEFMGHNDVQLPMHLVDDPEAMIRRTVEKIERFTGRPPRGWVGPGLTQKMDTVDLLRAAGIRYIGDWVVDDHPVRLQTAHGDLVAMPYSVEYNDVAMMSVQMHESEAFFRRVRDGFDRLWQEGEAQPRVMALGLHPYLMGVAHRIAHLEAALDHMRSRPGVLFWSGERLLDWYDGLPDRAARP